ncbi:hypothetical protein ACQ4N7_30150 [Nodosilinea sp. AN01ver1]
MNQRSLRLTAGWQGGVWPAGLLVSPSFFNPMLGAAMVKDRPWANA